MISINLVCHGFDLAGIQTPHKGNLFPTSAATRGDIAFVVTSSLVLANSQLCLAKDGHIVLDH